MATARPQRSRLRLAAVLVTFAGLLFVAPATAATKTTGSDTKAKQEEVRQKKAQVAAQINALKATNADLTSALNTLNAYLRQEQADLEAAQAAVDQATADADDINRQAAATQAKIDTLKATMTSVAVDTYARPPFNNQLVAMASGDINTAVRKQALLDIVTSANRDLADEFRGAKADLDSLNKAHNEALARAQAARAEVQARVTEVTAAKAQQQKLADAVDNRIDQLLNQIAEFNKQDAALAAQVQKELNDAIAAAQRAPRSSGGGGSTVPVGKPNIVNVQGIWVDQSIADQLNSLLNAAAAAGVELSGSGYRDPAGQIELRKAHCGTSDYAIWQMPSYQCSPPTARPGTSNHERGLAVDFTTGGFIIQRGSKAFQWLSANAAKYGFHNLPSEPWHWSPDGN